MNKKLLHGLLIATVLCGGMGSLTSCKDTDEDLFTQLKYDNLTIKDRVTTLEGSLKQVQDAQAQCKLACETAIKALQDRMAEAEKAIAVANATHATKEELAALRLELQTQISAAVADIASLKSQYEKLSDLAKDLKSQIDILNGKYDQLESYVNGKIDGFDQALKDQYDALIALINKNQIDIATLMEQKADKQDVADINAVIAGINNDIADIKNKLANTADKETVARLDERLTALENMLRTYEELRDRVATLEGQMSNLDKIYQPIIQDLEDIRGNSLKGLQAWEWIEQMRDQLYTIDQINALLNGKVDKEEFDDAMGEFSDKLTALEQKFADYVTNDELNEVVVNLRTEFNALYDQCLEYIGSLDETVGQHYTEFLRAMSDVNSNLDTLGTKYEALQQSVDANATSISDVESRVQTLEGQLADLTGRVNRLNDRLNRLITSIIVQGTVNPVFGTFSTPVGVQSNCLLTYYGYNESNATAFPNLQGSSRGSYNDAVPFTQKDVEMINMCGTPEVLNLVPGAAILPEYAANAGRVYVTVNPSNVDFSGAKWTINSSNGNESGITLGNLRKSDKQLRFGYSRSQEGFYEADAYLAPSRIQQTKLDIDGNALKDAFKNVVHDRSKNNVAHLAKALYDQINGAAPAFALRAAWNPEGQNVMAQVVSQYNLMATAIKPLSFATLYGHSFSEYGDKIPDLAGALAELHFNFNYDFNVKFDWQPINADDIEINIGLSPAEFNYTDDMALDVNVAGQTWHYDGIAVTWTDGQATVTPESMQAFLDAFRDQFNSNLQGWNAELQGQVRNAVNNLVDQVNQRVEQALNDAAANLQEKFADMLADLNQQANDKLSHFVDRFERLIDLYERARDRVIRFLDNPNHYLQPVMFYKADSEVHFLSTDKMNPTWVHAKGGNAVSLYATTYNAEIVAPTYSKFVAVTNVFTRDRSQSAQSGNQNCRNLLKKANSSPSFLHQLDGRNSRLAMPLPANPGYIYEITYSGLDYHGYSSTRRFYLQVKD